jgi:hypothetical protein
MKFSLVPALVLLPLLPLHATDPATQLADRGKLLLSDDLTQKIDYESWRLAIGKWELADGAARGTELAEDHHPGVMRHALPCQNVIFQYEVKLDGAKQTTFSINDAKEHVARVIIMPTGFRAQKDDHDHDGPDKAVPFPTKNVPFKSGEWHTVVAEIVGDTMVATVDGANPSAGSDPLLATPKANIGFTVSGATASVRNLRVWEATPKPEAEKLKQTLLAK